MSSRWISAADCSVTFIVYVTNVVSHSLNSPFIHLSGSPLFSTAVCPSWKGTENCTARREETNSYIPFRIGRWPKFHLPIQCMLDGLLANSLAREYLLLCNGGETLVNSSQLKPLSFHLLRIFVEWMEKDEEGGKRKKKRDVGWRYQSRFIDLGR